MIVLRFHEEKIFFSGLERYTLNNKSQINVRGNVTDLWVVLAGPSSGCRPQRVFFPSCFPAGPLRATI